MQSRRQKLTKSLVTSAEPELREYVVWDTVVAGFGLRVRPSGARSFVFVYRSPGGRAGKVRRVTISAANPDAARIRAKKLAGEHHGGGDPASAKALARRKAATPTVADLLDQFLTDHADKELRPKTAFEYRRIIEKILTPRLGHLAIDAIATKDVAEAYQTMRPTPTQAALAIRTLSSAMSLAEEWGLRPAGSNPARIRLKGTRRRERLFSDSEVARLLAAIDKLEQSGTIGGSVALGLRLLFATGCRAGEILGLEWAHIDFDEDLMRWPDSKTGYLEKPMTEDARALLEAADRIVGVPWVCPSPNRKRMRLELLEAGFEGVMREANVVAGENATLHLIRHWFASKTYGDKSIALPLQMALVGHTSVATAMRYSHTTREERRAAAHEAAQRRKAAIKAADKKGHVVRLEPVG